MPKGNRVAELREAQGLTQTKLAAQCDVVEITVRRWEAGKPIPERQWARLTEIFGVSVAYLLGLDKEDSNGNGKRKAVA